MKWPFSQNPLISGFGSFGFLIYTSLCANFKINPPWYIFFLSVHAPATSDLEEFVSRNCFLVVSPIPSHVHWKILPCTTQFSLEFFGSSSILLVTCLRPESENPRQRVSNADRKVFENPERFCKLIIGWRISGYFRKCPDTIQNIQVICSVRMNWKVFIWSKKFRDKLEIFQMMSKVSRYLKNVSGYSKMSLDDLEMYLDNLKSF